MKGTSLEMETLHIYDEFLGLEEGSDILHQKRMVLEPLLFDILKRKYGSILRTSFEKTSPPKDSKHCILIIERRIHPNLEFLLHNAAYFAPEWSICFVCSDSNLAYCKEIAKPHQDSIHFLPLFSGSPGRDRAREEYNRMLKSKTFYEQLPWETLWICQTDTYFRKPIPPSVFDYDFFAAPAGNDTSSMVGGMSFRKRDAMLRITEEYTTDASSEDMYISNGARSLGLKMPEFDKALELICESCLYEDSVAVHQWWTFFHPLIEDAEIFFHSFLTFELKKP